MGNVIGNTRNNLSTTLCFFIQKSPRNTTLKSFINVLLALENTVLFVNPEAVLTDLTGNQVFEMKESLVRGHSLSMGMIIFFSYAFSFIW